MENNNLTVLEKQFRTKGSPKRAYLLLSRLIENVQDKKLKTLLRDHRDNPISKLEEIEKRDDIDYLIQYYGLVFVAMVCGYIPENIPEKLRTEITNILGNKYVKKYYNEYYPLLLPKMLLEYVNKEGKFKISNYDSKEPYILFEKFLLLNDEIKGDEQVNQFLWFLDDGYTYGMNIYDLIELLSSKDKIDSALEEDDDDIIEDALWGYVKYMGFLNQFSKLLKQAEKYPYVFTSFYHYHGYWFFKMKKQMGNLMMKGLKNINYTVTQNAIESLEERFKGKINEKMNLKNNKSDIQEIIESSRKDLEETIRSVDYIVAAQLRLSKLNTLFN